MYVLTIFKILKKYLFLYSIKNIYSKYSLQHWIAIQTIKVVSNPQYKTEAHRVYQSSEPHALFIFRERQTPLYLYINCFWKN